MTSKEDSNVRKNRDYWRQIMQMSGLCGGYYKEEYYFS